MKKKLLMTALAIGINLLATNVKAQHVGFEVVDSIAGESLKLIQTAMPVFRSFGLTLDGYRIVVVTWDGNPGLIFQDAGKSDRQYGSPPGGKPSFEVQFSKDGTRVVRANFSR